MGAAAGGFTKVLLDSGARRVYAIDAGHGQLLGSLRADPRVVNLEATNVGELTRALVPELVDVVTIDVSYLALAAAVPQLERVAISPAADLVALVKPQFELGLARAPSERELLDRAVRAAIAGVQRARWRVYAWRESPVRGANAAIEFLLHAARSADPWM